MQKNKKQIILIFTCILAIFFLSCYYSNNFICSIYFGYIFHTNLDKTLREVNELLSFFLQFYNEKEQTLTYNLVKDEFITGEIDWLISMSLDLNNIKKNSLWDYIYFLNNIGTDSSYFTRLINFQENYLTVWKNLEIQAKKDGIVKLEGISYIYKIFSAK